MAAATIPVGFEVAGDGRQLEEDFLELLIASERVGNLVDLIKDTSNFHRCQCIQEAAVCLPHNSIYPSCSRHFAPPDNS
jgi:hypothetical protein